MAYPSLQEYNQALQHPKTALSDPDLQDGQVKQTGLGLPMALCGGFALTYVISNRTNKYAVRCFQKENPSLQLRYDAISEKLKSLRSPYFVDFLYRSQGVRVNGTWYPTVRMNWANGETLGEFVEKNYRNGDDLKRLVQSFSQLASYLESQSIAHGDIQPGNVMVSDRGKALQLIDYDGMFIPSLSPYGSSELGLRNFQHPKRNERCWDQTLDRFSFITLNISMRALEIDPSLWSKTHSDSETILFTASDYDNPESSAVFAELFKIPQLREDAKAFAAICKSSFSQTPTLDEFLGAKRQPTVVFTGKPTVGFGETPYYSSLQVLKAAGYHECLPYVGHRVEIIGKIVNVKTDGRTFRGDPYIFINFGDWRKKTVKAAIWADSIDLFDGIIDESWVGKWVSVIGLFDPPYKSDNFGYTHLTINLTQTNQIREISEAEAKRRLYHRWTPPASVFQDSSNVEVLEQVKRVGTTPPLQVTTLPDRSQSESQATVPQTRPQSLTPQIPNQAVKQTAVSNQEVFQKIQKQAAAEQTRPTKWVSPTTVLDPKPLTIDLPKKSTANRTNPSGVPEKPGLNQPSSASNPKSTTPTQSFEAKYCFIATALYGEAGEETIILRSYRDQKLLNSWYGRAFVSAYYTISPHLVPIIEKNKFVNRLARKLVDRIVRVINQKFSQ